MALVISSFYVSVGFLRHLKKKHEQSQQRHMKFLLPLRPQPGTTEKPQSQLRVCMVLSQQCKHRLSYLASVCSSHRRFRDLSPQMGRRECPLNSQSGGLKCSHNTNSEKRNYSQVCSSLHSSRVKGTKTNTESGRTRNEEQWQDLDHFQSGQNHQSMRKDIHQIRTSISLIIDRKSLSKWDVCYGRS